MEASGADLPKAPETTGAGSVLGRRKRILLLALGAVVLLTAGGLVGAAFVKSPAQVAAEQSPAAPTVLLAAVKKQVVGTTVVLRGSVAGAEDVTATPSPAGSGGPQQAAKPLVTATPKAAGALVNPGDVIVEVSGRPLVALAGDEPAYRDLRPGDSGKDVTELRNALGKLGFSAAGDQAGVFGAATKRAVQAYYQKIGFSAPTTGGASGEDQSVLQASQDAVTQAERHLRDAVDAAQGQPGNAVNDARADLATAQKRLADLTTRTGPIVPLAEVVFLPSFPARITKFDAHVGNPVEAPLVTLSSGQLQVIGRLDPADRAVVQAGAPAEIDSEVSGFHGTGKITAVGEQAQPTAPASGEQGQAQGQAGQASGQPFVPVTVLPDAPLDPGLIGQDVRLTLKFAQTSGPVLAVPSSAVTSSADGRTHVVVVGAGGAQRPVEVRAGKSGGGLVEVEPVAGGLAEGDQVVIGR
ncbi:peptidoglycan-binding protein [Amycolatopsis sp. H20-H5]|uniref:peptidoglycan-binding protein n=1 Tax=Amycolatopsis sp. H20-H5 TaxID=3046309 RepID=UPI002DB5B751|nr:peptidoglycan-binding protein [Amycolatopsis sp. H20-H5]MEC3979925.1 peptidoglycan-binding protein [Amycolatopsis sp. H20-H5]